MDASLADNAMRFLNEASFETVSSADTLPKGYRRFKSEYFSFSAVQQQETSSGVFLFVKKDKNSEASQVFGKAHDAITSWVGKKVASHRKETGQSSLFLGSDLAHFFSKNHEKEDVANTKLSCRSLASSQGEDDKTVLTAFSADDSQTEPDFMDDSFTLLTDDSDRSIPVSELRQSRIHQRLAPLLPGENVQLYEQYEAAYKSPSVWVIRVF